MNLSFAVRFHLLSAILIFQLCFVFYIILSLFRDHRQIHSSGLMPESICRLRQNISVSPATIKYFFLISYCDISAKLSHFHLSLVHDDIMAAIPVRQIRISDELNVFFKVAVGGGICHTEDLA